MTHKSSSTSKSQDPNEAQIRVNPQTGHEFIHVERPEVVSSAEMSDADALAFENARPTQAEVRNDRWSDQ